MEHLILSFNVVLPLLLLILVGCGIRKLGWIKEENQSFFNRLVFKVLLPVMLFYNISECASEINFSPWILLYAGVCSLAIFLITWLIVPRFCKQKDRTPVIIQAIYRGNYIIFGIPITATIYGMEHIGTTALLTIVVSPLYNLLAVVLLEYYCGQGHNFFDLVKHCVQNPLLLGSLSGLCFWLLGWHLPGALHTVAADIAAAATPLALICLGTSLKFSTMRRNLRPIFWVNLLRLMIIPLIFISISLLIGYRGPELIALTVLFGAPTAVASFIMATNAGADGELAGQLVLTTSLFSIVTIFFWVLFLSSQGFI